MNSSLKYFSFFPFHFFFDKVLLYRPGWLGTNYVVQDGFRPWTYSNFSFIYFIHISILSTCRGEPPACLRKAGERLRNPWTATTWMLGTNPGSTEEQTVLLPLSCFSSPQCYFQTYLRSSFLLGTWSPLSFLPENLDGGSNLRAGWGWDTIRTGGCNKPALKDTEEKI